VRALILPPPVSSVLRMTGYRGAIRRSAILSDIAISLQCGTHQTCAALRETLGGRETSPREVSQEEGWPYVHCADSLWNRGKQKAWLIILRVKNHARRADYSTLGSVSLPTAPCRSAACKTPVESRKNERRPVRPYCVGVPDTAYFAGAPSVLAPRIT